MSISERKLRNRSSAQRFQMRAASGQLAHFMRNRTHIRPGSNPGAKLGTWAVHAQDFELHNFNLYRLERYVFFLAGELISRDALNLLCGKRRRDLLDDSAEICPELPGLLKRE